MNKYPKLSLIAIFAIFLNAEEVILDTVDVDSAELKAEKKVYQETKAVSARDDIATSTQNLDTILRTIPGTFTNQDKSTGTIAPNIRGSQGFGRVNTMVDGVTQTFYSSGVDDGKSGSTSQFGASVDPNFIAGVDVERGTFSGKNGVNSLMGSANFRTLSVDDVIKGDKDFGFLGKYQVGDNAYKSNYMGTFAGRTHLDNGAYFGVLVGHSNRKISQDYKVGGGIKINEINDIEFENLHRKYIESQMFEFVLKDQCTSLGYSKEQCDEGEIEGFGPTPGSKKPERWTKWVVDKDEYDKELKDAEGRWKENNADQYVQIPFDPNKLKQNIKSYMTKIEYGDDYNFLTLSFRNLENKMWAKKTTANNYQLNYNLNNSDNIDLNMLLAYTQTKQHYSDEASISGKQLIADLETKNNSLTFDISNTINKNLTDDLALNSTIGLNNLTNRYSKNRHPYELVWFHDYRSILDGKAEGYYEKYGKNYQKLTQKDKNIYFQKMINGEFLGNAPSTMSNGGFWNGGFKDSPSADGYKANTFQPDGKQKFFTIYADNYLEYKILGLNLNANLVKYDYNGKYFDRLDKTKNYINNEFMFDDYGNRRAFNYSAILTANLHDLFTPFVSYSKNERFPNLQELYFTQRTSLGISNHLQNEIAKTWQIGFNSFKEDLLFDRDIFGFKAVYYKTNIDNYIHNVLRPRYRISEEDKKDVINIEFQNYDKKVTKKGIELELSYDMGLFYANLAYARQSTTQPTSASDASPSLYPAPGKSDYYSMGHGISKVTMLPKYYGYVDTGVRFLSEKLVLGSRMKYFGESKRALYSTEDGKPLHDPKYDNSMFDKDKKHQKYVRHTEIIDKQPLVFDFYVSYEPIKNFTIKAELQNAFDKQYIDPLDANNDAASQRSYSILNGENNALSNYAKGRTAVLSFEYKY